MAGHYHRNAGGVYSQSDCTKELEVVTTSAVGTHLVATPTATAEERLGLDGYSFPTALSEADSGTSRFAKVPTAPSTECTECVVAAWLLCFRISASSCWPGSDMSPVV